MVCCVCTCTCECVYRHTPAVRHLRKFSEHCTYGLDPCNYYTLPGLSWDALLKVSGARLELLYDIDQYQFIEHGMRRGVSMVTRRHARANNSRLPDYDSTKPTTYLQYLDANNLYGWAMCQSLPLADFKWEEVTPSLHVMVLAQSDDAPVGYIVECDMSVPPGLTLPIPGLSISSREDVCR